MSDVITAEDIFRKIKVEHLKMRMASDKLAKLLWEFDRLMKKGSKSIKSNKEVKNGKSN